MNYFIKIQSENKKIQGRQHWGNPFTPIFFGAKKKKGKQSLSNQLKNWKFITLAVYFEERGWAKKKNF